MAHPKRRQSKTRTRKRRTHDSISFIAFSLLLDIFFLEIPKTGKNFLYFSTFITLFAPLVAITEVRWLS